MIAVVLPTRGLVFTEVEEAIQENLYGMDYEVYRSFNLPIPDGINQLTDKALSNYLTDYILYIEEDTVIPKGSLDSMIQSNAQISCIDYGVEGWSCITKDKSGEILWCGLGCTLVRRIVFDQMEKPYFRIDKSLRLNDWANNKADWVDNNLKKSYGGQDIYFFMKAREKGFKIVQIEGECKHLKLESLGEVGVNGGLHKILQRPLIEKHQVL